MGFTEVGRALYTVTAVDGDGQSDDDHHNEVRVRLCRNS